MTRSFTRREITDRKVRRELDSSRINKRKYYGVGVEIEDYKSKIDFHVNHTAVIDSLEDQLVDIGSESEDFAEDIVDRQAFLRSPPEDADEDSREEYILAALLIPLENSFDKGTRRAFDERGNQLPPASVESRVSDILQEQRNYISNLTSDMREKAVEVIRDGVSAGLSKTSIKQNLRSELKSLQENRGSTIAESEVIAAAGKGVEETFDANGVDRVRWVTELDESTCEQGAFQVSYNGESYTSCPELDGESFDRTGNHPVPVTDSHPNCRCVLVGVTE